MIFLLNDVICKEGGGGKLMLSDDESFRASNHFHSLSVEEIRFVATTPRAMHSSSFCPLYCMQSKIGLTIAN
jgi:hypothetical protein